MRELGISLYPEHSTPEKDIEYMQMASKLGFTRIFTCLLCAAKSKEAVEQEFGTFIASAHRLGFTVAADTNPQVFDFLGATPDNLEVFKRMGLDIVRLDGNFGEVGDRLITRNQHGLRIEFNASSDAAVDLTIRHGGDVRNLQVCHNFYPERYTGHSLSVFRRFNRKWQQLGLPIGAFVSSAQPNTFGPWQVSAGLPTLEQHRGLPIGLQARHMVALEAVDTILVGNAYASKQELQEMSSIDLTKTTISVVPEPELGVAEQEVLSSPWHCGRLDASPYFIRSCKLREAFRERSIPWQGRGNGVFHRGDVVVVNDNLKHYRGELEVVLMDFADDGERNLVGRIPPEEFCILDLMEEAPEHFWGFRLI